MNAPRTARARARAELTTEITRCAREQLRTVGASELSLRAVARELGMASSAIYRYFASRDELLTALITEAYDALGAAVERADAALTDAALTSGSAAPRARWRAVCTAVRDWARTNPHEYALIYGSPVPGYRAPAATVTAATRSARVIGAVAATGTVGLGPEPSPELARQLGLVAAAVAPDAPAELLGRAMVAWTQLFGMVGFELFGQFANTLDPADEFFGYAVERSADLLGLPA